MRDGQAGLRGGVGHSSEGLKAGGLLKGSDEAGCLGEYLVVIQAFPN